MGSLIGDWVGRIITVTLKVGGMAGVISLEGKLLRADASGVLLEQPKGTMYAPTSAILHVMLRNDA
jgi:hypothetical protein